MTTSPMIAKIKTFLVSSFENQLFDAALSNLDDFPNPLRLNNFANALREFTRHVLARLAPDARVRACMWFREETDKPLGISRRQRMVYAIQGGLDDDYVTETLAINAKDTQDRLLNVINGLSKFTHIEEGTFGTQQSEIDKYVTDALSAVSDMFRAVSECRSLVATALYGHVSKEVLSRALEDTIESIDILATHHRINSIWVDEVKVEAIDSTTIHIVASGKIECELQWGSGGDLRRGDGLLANEHFPFSCELKSDVTNPGEFQPDLSTLEIDTRSWYE